MNGYEGSGIVLVASDDIVRLEALSVSARQAGCTVRTVSSGKLALRVALAEALSVLVVDLADPDLDGFEVVANLKAVVRTREIPVIVVNRNQRDAATVRSAYEAGATDVLEPSVTAEAIGRKAGALARLVAERGASGSKASRLLADVTDILGRSLDVRMTLPLVADRLLPELADWCLVDAFEGPTGLRQITASHADPDRIDWARNLRTHRVFDDAAPQGIALVKRTARVATHAAVGHVERIAEWLAIDASELDALRALGAGGCMIVPVSSRGRVLGVIALVSTESRTAFDRASVALAEDVAHRVAVAMDHASLHDDARRAMNERDQLLSVVTHDLRNPLSAILSSADLLLQVVPDDAVGSRMKRTAELIVKAADRLDVLTRELLDFARLQSGRVALTRVAVDATEVLVASTEAYEARARAKSVRLTFATGSTARIECDRERVRQVFGSLIENAIEESPEGSTITLRVEVVDDEVVFSVGDAGGGISREAVAHFFDHAWSVTHGRGSGLGLGLALAKGLVEAHGGRMWVATDAGAGTTVHFAIRRAR